MAENTREFTCIKCMSYPTHFVEGYWECEQCGIEDVAVLTEDVDKAGASCWKTPFETTTDADPFELDYDCVDSPDNGYDQSYYPQE